MHNTVAVPGSASAGPPAPRFAGTPFDVVAIASSRGGLSALRAVLARIPPDFPAAIVVVQHLSPDYRIMLPEILAVHAPLPVRWAADGEILRPATIYLAHPDHHVRLTTAGAFHLSQEERVQYVRPSADVLFESVSTSYRERAIAVVLTGGGSDGAHGVSSIKGLGGRVLAEDPATADTASMPAAAIRTGCVDFVLPLASIPPALITLVMAVGAAPLFKPAAPPT